MSQSSSPPSSDPSLERRLQKLARRQSTIRAFLLILDGPRAGRLHALGEADTLIGRREDADVTMSDSAVSTEHARLEHRGDAYYLVDLGSRNGTQVNGQHISERRLRKKDRIQIGGTTLVFLEEGSAESTVTVTLAQPDSTPPVRRVPRTITTEGGARQIVKPTTTPEEESPIIGFLRKAIQAARFVRRHAWVLLPMSGLGLAAGALSVRLYPAPEVASGAVKLMQTQQLNPVDAQQNVDQKSWEAAPTFFEKPEQNFANSELAQTVLNDLSIPSNPGMLTVVTGGLQMKRDGEAYVARYSQSLKARVVPPVEFLDHYLERYLQREVDRAIQVIKAEAGFVENELKKVDTELHQIETELLDFQKKHISSLPEQAGAVIAGKGTLTISQAQAELEVDRLRSQVVNARSQLNNTDTVLSRRVVDVQPIKVELEKKKRELGDLRAKGLRPDHPDIVQLNNQVASLEREIETRLNAGVTEQERITDPQRQETARKLQQYEADLRVAESGLSRLNKQVGAAAGIAAQLPMVEATVMRLKRRQEDLLGLRGQLFERHRKTMVQVDLETAQVRARYQIVAPVGLETGSSSKFLATRVGGGFGVGLAVALLIAGTLEMRRLLRRNPDLLRVNA